MQKKQLLIRQDSGICTLIMNRPDKMNSLTDTLITEIGDAFNRLSKDDSVRVVILRGAGDKSFCAGYDFGSLAAKVSSVDASPRADNHPLDPVADAIMNYPYPVIAMLNGAAFGAGCELAICCDIRIAADDIHMGLPPARIGLVYPLSGIQRFVRSIGFLNTKEMLFTANTYRGAILKDMGLVNDLVPRAELDQHTVKMAQRIASNAPLSLKGMKKVLNLLTLASSDGNTEIDSTARKMVERAIFSDDLKEGQRALIEKRKPHFTGK